MAKICSISWTTELEGQTSLVPSDLSQSDLNSSLSAFTQVTFAFSDKKPNQAQKYLSHNINCHKLR